MDVDSNKNVIVDVKKSNFDYNDQLVKNYNFEIEYDEKVD